MRGSGEMEMAWLDSMDGAAIGRRVKRAREEMGWSARTLARYAGVSHSYVSHLEQGMYVRPSVEQLRKIALGLGVSLGSLVEEESEREGQKERGVETGEAPVEGPWGEIQVNLKTIGRLDPGALESLAEIVAAVKEKVERERGIGRRRRG
jgi:transcriptional regulator with XRE-family HTH domain